MEAVEWLAVVAAAVVVAVGRSGWSSFQSCAESKDYFLNLHPGVPQTRCLDLLGPCPVLRIGFG